MAIGTSTSLISPIRDLVVRATCPHAYAVAHSGWTASAAGLGRETGGDSGLMPDSTTDERGVDKSYVDAGGHEQQISDETVARLREIIGEPSSVPGPLVIRPGEQATLGPGELRLEDNTIIPVGRENVGDLPL